MTDNKFDRHVTGKRSGKLDTKRLHKISTSSRLFKKKEERKGKHYNVTLLVDCSGSMQGSQIGMAVESTMKLGKHLEKMKVPFEIIGFNTFPYIVKDYNDKFDVKKIAEVEDKLFSITNGRYKVHLFSADRHNWYSSTGIAVPQEDEQAIKAARKKYGNEFEIASTAGWNCDGEAISVARQRIRSRKGQKIMVVFSDGQPAVGGINQLHTYNTPDKRFGDFDLTLEVQKAIKDNVTFIGIGIQDRSVERYYPKENVAVIDELHELYPALILKLQKLIKRG